MQLGWVAEGRLAGGSRTEHSERFSGMQLRKKRYGLRQHGRKVHRHRLIRTKLQNCLIKCERRDGMTVEFECSVVLADNNNLHRSLQEMKDGDAIRRREDAELVRNTGECFQCLLCFIPIILVAGVMMQPRQRNRRHGIASGRWGILQRFAAGGQHAKARAVGGRFAVEKSS